MPTKEFNSYYENTKKSIHSDWNDFLSERSAHEEYEDTVTRFVNLLGKKIHDLISTSKADEVDGVPHPTQTICIENPFLRALCNRWRESRSSYRRSETPVEVFFQDELEQIRREQQFKMRNPPKQGFYKPEALSWDQPTLAKLLGEYSALLDFQSELNASIGERSTSDANPLPEVKKRTQAMLLILVLSNSFDMYIPTREEIANNDAKYPFIQERLAELLSRMAGSDDVNAYQQAVKDVLTVFRQKGSRAVLGKAKALVSQLESGSEGDLAEFIQAEIDALDEDNHRLN